MTTHTFALSKHAQAWQQALAKVSTLLPSGVNHTDADALHTLPLFAIIVVLPKAVMANNPLTDITQWLQDCVKAWADTQANWQMIDVVDDNTHPLSLTPAESVSPQANTITPVIVTRHLLTPTTANLMHPKKKTAAAHIIDEQLTTHLRQQLNERLQIQNGATQAQQNLSDADALIDCHILSIAQMLRPHKLACFDMDSTLIEQEVINELAKAAGIGDEVTKITESAMRGEIEFDESYAKRLALLNGLSTTVLDDICSNITLSEGSGVILPALKALGYHTVLVSGGFTYFADFVAKKLGIDEVYANELDIDEGEVTGKVVLPIVNGERKAVLVSKIAEKLGIDMSQVVCIGDGANDLAMMAKADLGVAYKAKPIVQARADAAVNVTGLEGVLYALGYAAL